MPGMTSCHARDDIVSWQEDIMSCRGRRHVLAGITPCHTQNDIDDIMSCRDDILSCPDDIVSEG